MIHFFEVSKPRGAGYRVRILVGIIFTYNTGFSPILFAASPGF
jgi:hypothetical protein